MHATPDAVASFARHVAGTPFEALPADTITAGRALLLDSFGVALAGSRGAWLDEIAGDWREPHASTRAWGHRGLTMSAPHAALINAYQLHNSEFDCVHEAAVVHPMAVLLGALGTYIDRRDAAVSGRDLLRAVVLGIDVAAGLGVAARSPLRFFRPGTAGAFGAVAAISCVERMDADTVAHAFGLAYAQTCGTMQAHTEGLSLLAMQVGFNARNAVEAVDLARMGMTATRATLQGPYGYFSLFESDSAIEPVLNSLGTTWRVTEVAHKPFPSGRATHGIVDACLTLQREHGFAVDAIARVEARVPPLTHRLVGRPLTADMTPNYARLCGPYVVARALAHGHVGIDDFERTALDDSKTHALGARVAVIADDNPDPNALTPLTVGLTLTDGSRFDRVVDVIYGHPQRPMSDAARVEKFSRNWSAARARLSDADRDVFTNHIDRLEALEDVRVLLDLIAPRAE